jgi:hypothetical protein
MKIDDILWQFFLEEIEMSEYQEIIKNIGLEKVKKDFIEFMEKDLYDWFKSNFNVYIVNQSFSNWASLRIKK